MKLVISILLFSLVCNAQEFSPQQMQQKTAEAIVKFYGLNVIGNEALKRVQQKYLPEELKPAIPYFITLRSLIVSQKFVYRKEW